MLFAAPLAVLLLALAIPAAARPDNPPGGRRVGPLTIGQAPPPLSLERISGSGGLTLDALRGNVVVLDFWATWCGPCRAVMPILDDMHRRDERRGLTVVGMSPEPEPAIRRHLHAQPVGYTIARDQGGTMRAYGIRGIPTLVVLGRDGQVAEVMVGVDRASMARVDALVQRLLAQPAP
ncbi:MAG TPA: hypothetical protein DEF51_21025 [Myxococcales bacterium]|nr:hypothetical protein [Myxococcales bacterium]